MRFEGRIAPGIGSGPFTGQSLAASALSTMNPLRPPAQIFRGRLVDADALLVPPFVPVDLRVADLPAAVLAVALPVADLLAAARTGFELLEDPAALAAEPNESTLAAGAAALSGDDGGDCPTAGVAMIADARRRSTLDDCTSLTRGERTRRAAV
jgi:hypothetical protein